MRTPRLTKSRFQAGLQCAKHLWLLCHARELADEVGPTQQALFDHGHRVGALGREYFAGGVLVEEDHLHCIDAVKTTRYLLHEGFTCLYEGAFEYDGVLVRSDIVMQGDEGAWMLVEVKSALGVKPEFISDLGVQAYVLRGAGLPVSTCAVLHVVKDETCGGLDSDPKCRFSLVDVTAEVARFLPSVPGLLGQMKQMLAGPCPDTQVGIQCDQPHLCRFYGHCHSPVGDAGCSERRLAEAR